MTISNIKNLLEAVQIVKKYNLSRRLEGNIKYQFDELCYLCNDVKYKWIANEFPIEKVDPELINIIEQIVQDHKDQLDENAIPEKELSWVHMQAEDWKQSDTESSCWVNEWLNEHNKTQLESYNKVRISAQLLEDAWESRPRISMKTIVVNGFNFNIPIMG